MYIYTVHNKPDSLAPLIYFLYILQAPVTRIVEFKAWYGMRYKKEPGYEARYERHITHY